MTKKRGKILRKTSSRSSTVSSNSKMKPKSKRVQRHQPVMKRGEEKPNLSKDKGPPALFGRSSDSELEPEDKEDAQPASYNTSEMIHLLHSLTIPLLSDLISPP